MLRLLTNACHVGIAGVRGADVHTQDLGRAGSTLFFFWEPLQPNFSFQTKSWDLPSRINDLAGHVGPDPKDFLSEFGFIGFFVTSEAKFWFLDKKWDLPSRINDLAGHIGSDPEDFL